MKTDRLERELMEGSEETRWAPIVVKGTLFVVGIGRHLASSGAQESVAECSCLVGHPNVKPVLKSRQRVRLQKDLRGWEENTWHCSSEIQ